MAFVVENVVLLDALYDVIKTRPVGARRCRIIEFDAQIPTGSTMSQPYTLPTNKSLL